jgi:catechol 2,3-dioxygenase-like lactoylglutathione lyase family enzyme
VQFHQGRLLDHVHVRVADLEASKRFYRAVLTAVGRELTREGEGAFSADELYVTADRTPTAGLHIAFQANDRETVERFHGAGLAAGAGQRCAGRAAVPSGLLQRIRSRPG